MTRRRRDFIKRAIDSIANFEFVFEGLEMNVARAVLDRLIQDKVDKANNRGGVRLGFDGGAVSLTQLQESAGFAELFEDLLHARRIGAVILLDPVFNLFGRSDHNIDIFAQGKAQVLRGAGIKWINQRDAQGASAYSNRKRPVQPRQTTWNQTQNFRGDFRFRQIDIFRSEPIGDRFIKAPLINKAAIDHGLRDCFPV